MLRLFAAAREAAGTAHDVVPGDTVDAVLAEAIARYPDEFADVLPTCRIWVNGEPVPGATPVAAHDEIAVLPPVSGGTA